MEGGGAGDNAEELIMAGQKHYYVVEHDPHQSDESGALGWALFIIIIILFVIPFCFLGWWWWYPPTKRRSQHATECRGQGEPRGSKV